MTAPDGINVPRWVCDDEVHGDAENDSIEGGFGSDTVIGGVGDDVLTGSALSDEIFCGDGNDFVNGGDDGDRFSILGWPFMAPTEFRTKTPSRATFWCFGNTSATADQFQINLIETDSAGVAGVEEALAIYRPTGQIMWALVDGAAHDEIILRHNGTDYDPMA